MIKIFLTFFGIIVILALIRSLFSSKNEAEIKEGETVDAKQCKYCGDYVAEEVKISKNGDCNVCDKKLEKNS